MSDTVTESSLGAEFAKSISEHLQASNDANLAPPNPVVEDVPEDASADTPADAPQVTDDLKPKKRGRPPKNSRPTEDIEVETTPIGDTGDPLNDLLGGEVETEPEEDVEQEIEDKYKDEPDDPKAKAKWGELKGELKSLRKTLAEREKELNQLRALADNPQESEYKAKYESLIQSNPLLALQDDQDFQQKVAAPYQEAVSLLNGIITDFNLPMDKITEAMNASSRTERNRKLSSILNDADIDEFSKGDFMQAIAQYEALHGKFTEAQERAVELYEASRQKQMEQQTKGWQEQIQTLKKTSVDVLQKMEARPYFKEIFDNDTAAKEFKDRVLSSLEKEPTPEMASFEKAASFALGPAIKWGLKMKQERDEAIAALKKRSGGDVAIGDGQAPGRQTVDEEDKGPVGAAFARAMKMHKF